MMRKLLSFLYNILFVNGESEPTNLELGLFAGIFIGIIAFLVYLFN